MRKFNYNIIVFAAAVLLIVGGWCSGTFLGGMKGALVSFIDQPNVEAFVKNVDEASKNISYQGALIDMTSLIYRGSDTRIVKKADATVVRMDNDYLAFSAVNVSDEEINEKADGFERLKNVAEDQGIPFVYVMAPGKAYYGSFPMGVANTYKESYDRYRNALENRGIHVLDLAEKMTEQNIPMEKAFYMTDHHWLPETGIWAAGEICDAMKAYCGISYDSSMMDVANYDVEVYQDVFLGSEGKKVGQYFTPLGLDDISIITPKFETNLTVEDTKGLRTGSFEETLIDDFSQDNLNLYYDNLYATYSHGDFGLQVVKNQLADVDAPKVVIIRDSYACVVTPFLSLSTESLHIIDIRYWQGTDTADTIYEYIQQEKPDCVLALYTGLGHVMPAT